MRIVIREIEGDAERRAVLQQRRDIYADELGYAAARTDPGDPLDDTGHLFGAFVGPRLVGSVRVNYGCDAPDGGFGEYAALHAMHRFGDHFPDRLSMVSRLLIERPYRSGTLMARFAIALYEYTRCRRPATAFCLVDCVPSLKHFFLRLGYRQIGAPFRHPIAGTVLPMAFVVYDLDHFRRAGSPLAKVCPHQVQAHVDSFEHLFAQPLARFAPANAGAEMSHVD